MIRARGVAELREALAAAKRIDRTVVIHIEVDRYRSVESYESWWDVPVAEVGGSPEVAAARDRYEKAKTKQRRYL